MAMPEDGPLGFMRSINKEMRPEEPIEAMQKYIAADYNDTKAPVYAARALLLQQNGYEPSEWVFYTNYMPLDSREGITDPDLARVAGNFPDGVEFLGLPGGFSGGITEGTLVQGIASYQFMIESYSLFARVRPLGLT